MLQLLIFVLLIIFRTLCILFNTDARFVVIIIEVLKIAVVVEFRPPVKIPEYAHGNLQISPYWEQHSEIAFGVGICNYVSL